MRGRCLILLRAASLPCLARKGPFHPAAALPARAFRRRGTAPPRGGQGPARAPAGLAHRQRPPLPRAPHPVPAPPLAPRPSPFTHSSPALPPGAAPGAFEQSGSALLSVVSQRPCDGRERLDGAARALDGTRRHSTALDGTLSCDRRRPPTEASEACVSVRQRRCAGVPRCPLPPSAAPLCGPACLAPIRGPASSTRSERPGASPQLLYIYIYI